MASSVTAPDPDVSAPPALDRRQRRKAETQKRLLDAACRLFAARGFEATRPQDIAREADVAIGTFYLHFRDRREAFAAFTARAAEDLIAHVRARGAAGAPFEVRLRAMLAALLDYIDQHPGVVRVAFADESVIGAGAPRGGALCLRERLAEALARGFELGMARGELRDDYDPLLLGHAVVGLIQQALNHGVRRSLDRDRVLDQVTRFCARALVHEHEEDSP